MKLYGQMSPNTMSGGCQLGFSKLAYQPGLVDTQIPDPTAYTTTSATAATLARIRQVVMPQGWP